MRRRLPWLCIALCGCVGLAASGRPLAAPAAGLRENSLLRLVGDDALDQPLLPQPGNIWAGVLPNDRRSSAAAAANHHDEPTSSGRGASPAASSRAAAHSASRVEAPTPGGYGAGRRNAEQNLGRQSRVAPPATGAAGGAGNAPAAPAVADRQSNADSGPMVQLAAAESAQRAVAAWRRLRQEAPLLTDGHDPAITAAEVDGRTVWRLRAGGFADLAAARAFCSGLRAAKAACWVVPSSMLR